MNKKIICIFIVAVFISTLIIPTIYADTTTDNALNFLKSKQDTLGKITNGFSSPSQWAAIAFASNGIENTALKNFLLTDVPTSNNATDWESRILAIVAINGNPTNFGETNYVQNLEGFYNNNQLGDTCSLNDDIFGLLALVASGGLADSNIKQHVLDFIISKQDPLNGGFGWSAPGCPWYDISSDMTAAAIQALEAAKDVGLTNANLDNTISRAKAYLLTTQNSDGGFGYFGSSDADSTGWVLQSFNILDIKESTPSARAKNYLVSKQQADGGFAGYNGSDSTTTAQALIALSGKGWILKIYTPSATPSATPSSTPFPIPTPTPVPMPTTAPSPSPSPTNTPTPSPTITPTPSPTPILTPTPGPVFVKVKPNPSPSVNPSPEVLGTNIESVEPSQKATKFNFKKTFLSIFSLVNFVGAGIFWKMKM